MGTLKMPRIVICASGVITSAASSARLTQRTALRTALSNGMPGARSLHAANLVDVATPVGKVLVDLREHRGTERIDVETVLLLDEHHAFGFQVLAVLRGGVAIPVQRLLPDLDHRVL